MAVAYSSITQPGLLSQQYPPPLLPKPGKDNARLQKLLKKSAKKKASAQAAQSAGPFRSSLSPVNEASPDLEHSDHSTPPRTPETPLYAAPQHPRFTVRPLYQHVASPYPQRVGFGRATRFSPQTVPAPSQLFSQHVTSLSSYVAPAHPAGVSPAVSLVTQQAAPKISVSEVIIPAVEATVVAASSAAQSHAALKPAGTVQPKPRSPVPTPYSATGTQAVIRPLTVLTQHVKPKSPRPTFKANEATRSPKSMFDVPQIRMYTATTSYYETSRTPPVYDTAGLTAIGTTLPQLPKTPTQEIKRGATPTSEVKRGLTPTSEMKRDATPVGQSPVLGAESQRRTPTSEIKRGTTPTGETNGVKTPTSEVKRVTPTTEIKRAKTPTYDYQTSRTLSGRPKTPSYHVTRAKTPVFEISKPNPLLFAVSPVTVEPERSKTPTAVSTSQSVKPSEPKPDKTVSNDTCALNGDIHVDVTPAKPPAAKPTQESITKAEPAQQEAAVAELKTEKTPAAPLGFQTPTTPTSEPLKPAVTSYGYQRPKTPTTPTSEPLKPAVTSYGYQRPKTPTTPTSEPLKPAVASYGYQRPKTPTTPTSEPIKPAVASYGYQRPKTPTTPTSEPIKPAVTSYGYQRPKTPTYEASRLMTASTGFPRPRTPSYGTPSQRPKTPTHVAQKPKSSYRGLTPAEYVAYGGIQSFTPAFGISRPKTPTQEEVEATKEVPVEDKTPSHESPVKTQSVAEVSKADEAPKEVEKPQIRDERVSAGPAVVVPSIVVSQASDISETTLSAHTPSKIPGHAAATHEQTAIQEKPKVKPVTVEVKTPEKERVKTPTKEIPKPKIRPPEAKRPLPTPASKGEGQVPLVAIAKLLAKDTVQTTEQETVTKTKPVVSDQKESVKPSVPAKPKAEGPKLNNATPPAKDTAPAKPALDVKAPAESTVTAGKEKDEKGKSASEKKEGDDSLPAAEPLLKVLQKPKGVKSKMSGWSRLKKHMVVEQEEPQFPESEPEKKTAESSQGEAKADEEKAVEKSDAGTETQSKDTAKATQMWDAVLFQMFSTKENIMHQIELSKSEEERKTEEAKEESKDIPTFAHRLPVLLFSPRFDAKKLKEAASRPLTKISTVFEMGLIGRKNKDEEPKDFNRTARGFAAS